MVKIPRIGRIRLPRLDGGNWRARLRAQRRWWRQRLRVLAGDHEVLFPAEGGGVVAVETLTGESADGPRIAILHATAGSGHKRAAQALAAALAAERPDALVREVDTLVFASRWYRGTYAQSYTAMAARAPALWAALYHSSAMGPVHRGTAPVRLAVDRLNLTRLVRVVERERPDAVVCTHFLPVEALSHARGRGRLGVPLYCVITDFTAHPFWAFPYASMEPLYGNGFATYTNCPMACAVRRFIAISQSGPGPANLWRTFISRWNWPSILHCAAPAGIS